MERKNFIKNTEDFICGHCGTEVAGTGYTNHCPDCLWSQHVDNLPGDRANPCHGMMEPVGLEISGDQQDILHRCLECGQTKNNKRDDADSTDAIIRLSHND